MQRSARRQPKARTKLSFDDQLEEDMKREHELSLLIPDRWRYLSTGLQEAFQGDGSRDFSLDEAIEYLHEEISPTYDADLEPSELYENVLHSIATILALKFCPCPDHFDWTCAVFETWVKMCDWTVHLLYIYVLGKRTPKKSKGKAFQHRLIVLAENLCHIPGKYGRFNEAFEGVSVPVAFSSVPHLIPTMIKVSIHLLSLDHPWYMTTWMKIHDEAEKIPDKFKACIEEMETEHGYNIAQYLTDHFSTISSQSDIDFCTLRSDIILLLQIFHSCPESNIFHRMLSRGVTKAFANIMVAAASQAYLVDAPPIAYYDRDNLSFLSALLARCLTGGITWVCEALDCHFLIALVQLAVLPDNGDAHIKDGIPLLFVSYAKLTKLLRPFLVYRSVLNRTRRELRLVRDSELLGRLDERNSFRLALEDLDREAERLKGLQRQFESSTNLPSLCSVQKCWWVRPGAKLQRCSGCRVAVYCSRQCQRADWEKHKELCDKYDRPTDGLSYRISQLDTLFLKFLIQREIRERPVRPPAHNRSGKKSKSKVRAEDVVVQFNLRVSPMQVTYTTSAKVLQEILSLSTGLTDDGLHRLEHSQWAHDRMAMLKDRVRENPTRTIMCYMLFPAGYSDSYVLWAEQV
ncbi:hypothetical protein E1B28_002708 [Marasmius oreades]|uniref:MYND-type domain-containing protein n=1 Tax=Marasmius oreades TaxID=181124 RepID=A0A9P7ULT5_9AGAR|nr:uncharacterized protein E1B28_002708 [Marasmius oreades]KAG7086778.1 hypothetical protein E1B28_002708 [Marasmius oreades]